MGRISEWVVAIKGFTEFTVDAEAEETQVSAKKTEKFVKEVTERLFPEAWLFKTGSQQHPDFLVSTQEVLDQIQRFGTGPRGGRRKLAKGLILEWEQRRGLGMGVRLLRLEVKSTTGERFVLNDTFPSPDPKADEVYVMFAGGDRKVYVTTSATMATYELEHPPSISDRYAASDRAVNEFGAKLDEIWNGTPVGTAPRPTYSVDVSYARREASVELLTRLFESAGLPDQQPDAQDRQH